MVQPDLGVVKPCGQKMEQQVTDWQSCTTSECSNMSQIIITSSHWHGQLHAAINITPLQSYTLKTPFTINIHSPYLKLDIQNLPYLNHKHQHPSLFQWMLVWSHPDRTVHLTLSKNNNFVAACHSQNLFTTNTEFHHLLWLSLAICFIT